MGLTVLIILWSGEMVPWVKRLLLFETEDLGLNLQNSH